LARGGNSEALHALDKRVQAVELRLQFLGKARAQDLSIGRQVLAETTLPLLRQERNAVSWRRPNP
jgi:hypothetical protein